MPAGVSESQLLTALKLVRDFRAAAMKYGLNPVVFRAVLKFALQVDREVIVRKGLNLKSIEEESDKIAGKLLEMLKEGMKVA